MKKSLTIGSVIFCLVIFLFTGVLIAGERVKIIEMADGNLVTFRMTAEEIAAEDGANAEAERRKKAKSVTPRKRVVTFEMGESGRLVSFPMTRKEIAAEDAETARLKAIHIAHVLLPEPRTVRFELPESGMYIVFPAAEKKSAGKGTFKTATGAGAETIE